MKNIKNRQENGFSILEIVLAVAVAGIVAVIAFPTFIGLLDDTTENQVQYIQTACVNQDKVSQATGGKLLSQSDSELCRIDSSAKLKAASGLAPLPPADLPVLSTYTDPAGTIVTPDEVRWTPVTCDATNPSIVPQYFWYRTNAPAGYATSSADIDPDTDPLVDGWFSELSGLYIALDDAYAAGDSDTFTVKARCFNNGSASEEVVGEPITVTFELAQPNTPTSLAYDVDTINRTQATITWNGSTCVGSTTEYRVSVDGIAAEWDTYTGGLNHNYTATQGLPFEVQVEARCVSGEEVSPVVSATETLSVPIVLSPTGISNLQITIPTTAGELPSTISWDAGTCAYGVPEYQAVITGSHNGTPFSATNGGWNANNSFEATLFEETTYSIQVTGRCVYGVFQSENGSPVSASRTTGTWYTPASGEADYTADTGEAVSNPIAATLESGTTYVEWIHSGTVCDAGVEVARSSYYATTPNANGVYAASASDIKGATAVPRATVVGKLEELTGDVTTESPLPWVQCKSGPVGVVKTFYGPEGDNSQAVAAAKDFKVRVVVSKPVTRTGAEARTVTALVSQNTSWKTPTGRYRNPDITNSVRRTDTVRSYGAWSYSSDRSTSVSTSYGSWTTTSDRSTSYGSWSYSTSSSRSTSYGTWRYTTTSSRTTSYGPWRYSTRTSYGAWIYCGEIFRPSGCTRSSRSTTRTTTSSRTTSYGSWSYSTTSSRSTSYGSWSYTTTSSRSTSYGPWSYSSSRQTYRNTSYGPWVTSSSRPTYTSYPIHWETSYTPVPDTLVNLDPEVELVIAVDGDFDEGRTWTQYTAPRLVIEKVAGASVSTIKSTVKGSDSAVTSPWSRAATPKATNSRTVTDRRGIAWDRVLN